MNKVILIRGIPGSGKSTKAKDILSDYEKRGVECRHYENDQFFINRKTGEYVFNIKQRPIACMWCLDKFKKAVDDGVDVIVSNTFTRKWEMEQYIDYAEKAGCEVIIYRMTGNYGNIHGVPEDHIKLMAKGMEDFPGEIIC